MGRTRKIPMVKRETAEQRSVTFTKRRQGLFNKAADLCRICDAQIAIMVSSAGSKEKVYTFGHSSVDAVFDRFLYNFTAAPEAVAYEAGIKSASNSLYEEIKALEGDVNTLMRNNKRNGGGVLWDSLEEIERSSTSVEELQNVVDILESLLGQAKNKMNNATGNLGISIAVEPRSDDFLALEPKPQDDSSSSLGGDQIGQNSAIVGDDGAHYSASYWNADGSTTDSGMDFPVEIDVDLIWNLLEPSDFSSGSDKVISINNSSDCTTSGTASESAAGSQENEDSILLTTNLDSELFKDIELVDCGTYNTTPDPVSGDIDQHYAMDGDCNAKLHDSALITLNKSFEGPY
ncbi:PREDICTED: agamous-like MADS-box protein AGL62 [Populus euphratica]|uniref:Agamous-like MADS-box protein AGL62 n=1 Tax=Populus euphratica TaxID=75702 RepID=A0AAJ6V834_POPEU|nr:PREDICTED: agamous-like MADS-box protein AGL62 [Populus euphratica]